MTDTKAGRDPEGAVKEIEAQAQQRSICPKCKGEKVVVVRGTFIACPKCGNEVEGTVPAGPQGDLAECQERVSVSLESALHLCRNHNKLDAGELNILVLYIEQRVESAKAYLAAMPQAQPDAELLEALGLVTEEVHRLAALAPKGTNFEFTVQATNAAQAAELAAAKKEAAR